VLIGARLNKNRCLYYYEKRDGFSIIWININKYFGKSLKRILNMLLYSILALNLYLRKKSKLLRFESPDIIIGSSVHLFGAYGAYLLSRLYHVPFVFEVRDLWPQTLIDMGELSNHHPLTKILRYLEKHLYEKSVFIISLLPFAYEYICSNYNIKREKIRWLPNGVNFDLFPGQPYAECANFTISYLGSHGIANSLEIILYAAEIIYRRGFSDIKFNFIGDGPLKPLLNNEVQKRKMHNVQFCDPIPKNELYKVALYTNAFVVSLRDLPLYRYGISLNKIYEYMSMSRPIIIACNARNNPVEKACAGISVNSDSPEAMAEAIIELRKMPREKLIFKGKNGRDYVKSNHDFKILGRRLEGWLCDVLRDKEAVYAKEL